MNFTPMVVSRSSSNDEESVCAVPLQLFDESELPLQVRAHRGGRRIRALVGALVSPLARTRLQSLRVLPGDAIFSGVVEDVNIPRHLREPGCGHGSAWPEVIAEYDACAAHRGEEVCLL